MQLKTTLLFTFVICFSTFAQVNENKPVKSFQQFYHFFNDNYASFNEKNIDWQSRYMHYKDDIDASTADTTLFRIMKTMLKDFKDAHVNLRSPSIDSFFNASRNSAVINRIRPIPASQRRKQYNAMTDSTLGEFGFKPMKYIGPEYDGRPLFSYTHNDTVGYLRSTRSFSSHKFLNLQFTQNLLNKIFKEFKPLQAVILDVRFNMGGDVSFTNNLVGRFTDKRFLGDYKQNRRKGKFSKINPNHFGPRGKYRFTDKPVAILLNDQTISSADELTLVLKNLPNITLIGEPSNGSYSNMKPKKLANGWVVTLSYQRYTDISGTNYEGKGTPVDFIQKTTIQDVQSGNDSVLRKALQTVLQK